MVNIYDMLYIRVKSGLHNSQCSENGDNPFISEQTGKNLAKQDIARRNIVKGCVDLLRLHNLVKVVAPRN